MRGENGTAVGLNRLQFVLYLVCCHYLRLSEEAEVWTSFDESHCMGFRNEGIGDDGQLTRNAFRIKFCVFQRRQKRIFVSGTHPSETFHVSIRQVIDPGYDLLPVHIS